MVQVARSGGGRPAEHLNLPDVMRRGWLILGGWPAVLCKQPISNEVPQKIAGPSSPLKERSTGEHQRASGGRRRSTVRAASCAGTRPPLEGEAAAEERIPQRSRAATECAATHRGSAQGEGFTRLPPAGERWQAAGSSGARCGWAWPAGQRRPALGGLTASIKHERGHPVLVSQRVSNQDLAERLRCGHHHRLDRFRSARVTQSSPQPLHQRSRTRGNSYQPAFVGSSRMPKL